MFQDALYVPEGHLRDRALALPLAALVHAVALALLVTVPLLRVGDLPQVDVSDVIVVPALPATPPPPPKARSGDPGARIAKKRAIAPTADTWRVAPEIVPVGIVEEGVFGAGGSDFGIPGGVDYGLEGGLPANLLGDALYNLIGEVEPAPVLAVGEVKPPKLVRRVEPDYPKLAQEARVQGVVILEATTDVYGRVTSLRVQKSVTLLDEAAMAAVRQWVYEPLVVNGRPRPVTFSVTVRFVLQ
ncbi:MAG TPA: energy transducer TonB [Acidobacteriota bacterium]|nr:energy transducer TonB [Acidobacteriota bacterium]